MIIGELSIDSEHHDHKKVEVEDEFVLCSSERDKTKEVATATRNFALDFDSQLCQGRRSRIKSIH